MEFQWILLEIVPRLQAFPQDCIRFCCNVHGIGKKNMAEAPANWIQLEFCGIPTFHQEFMRIHWNLWRSVKTTRTTPEENGGGQSTFNGVNLLIGSSADTICHDLFIWSKGSVLLG